MRSARACKRPGLPIVPARPTREGFYRVTFGSTYRGRPGNRRLIGTKILGHAITAENWRVPPEDPAGGCPGHWYRTTWIDSIAPFERARTEGGARVPNPLLDASGDWLLWQAITYLEHEQERWHDYIAAERARRWDVEEAKRKQDKGARPRGRRRR